MNSKNRKKLKLVGLNCASCSTKIENEIKMISDVDNAYIDFANGNLIIEANNKYFDDIVDKAINIVNKIEPHVNVINDDNKEIYAQKKRIQSLFMQKEREQKVIRLIIGSIFFVAGIMFDLEILTKIIIFMISYLIIGGDVVLKSFKNIIRGEVFDENFLMVIATFGAFAIGEFTEGVAVMMFYQIGEFIQDSAVNKSRKSISNLMNIRPDYVNLKSNNNVKVVSPEKVNVGDIILVKPGEKIPLDGCVVDGEAMLDTSAITGESVTRKVSKGDEVLSGFINNTGLLTIRVLKKFKESTVSKILNLVENAGSKKAQTEKFITKFARYYTPSVVLGALALSIVPPLFIEGALFSTWMYRGLVFLVISCPCALVISIPLGFFGGIGAASKKGILIKGGNHLEVLNELHTVVFDKTGTLTKGQFKVIEIKSKNGYNDDDILKYAAYAEKYSNHPIAVSVLNQYKGTIDEDNIKEYNELPGQGVKACVFEKEVLLGNNKLMQSKNIEYDEIDAQGSIVHIAIEKQYRGYIVISDEIKQSSGQTVRELKNLGINKIVMLTGDNNQTAIHIGKKLGIDDIHAQLLPQHKVKKFEDIYIQKESSGKVAFVGDGINDAPVLARSDIGIAMGGLGSDAAIEAADIVLMTDEPSKIVTAIKIAKRTRKIVIQNIILALGIKALVLLMGAIGYATMWAAVFADVGVAVLAILNSMRVLNVKNI